MSNLRILSIENIGNLVDESTDKSSFTINIPEDMINLGRCLVELQSGFVQVQRSTVDTSGNIDATIGRIVPSNVNALLIRTNIEQVGYSSFTGGYNNIIGTCLLEGSLTAAASQLAAGTGRDYIGRAGNDIATIQKQGVFLCERLPSQLKVEKVYYTDAASPQLVPADSYTAQTLPLQLILKLTFLDMN
tara:strand:+ start:694 stop:1260 length:567 start_codon:yes stop_codon:yes gene_type:complete